MADQLIIDASTASLIVQNNPAPVIDVGPAPGSTDALPEGLTNLYHTTARAADAAPVQSVVGRDGDVVLAIADVADLQTTLDGKQATIDQSLNTTDSVSFSALALSSFTGNNSQLVFSDDNGGINQVGGLDAATQGQFRTSLGCGTAAASNALVGSTATITALTVNGTTNTSAIATIKGAAWFGSVNGNQGLLYQGDIEGKVKAIGITNAFSAYRHIEFQAGNFPQFFCDTSGNVGIQNNTPQARIDVNGGILARNTYTSTTNFERGFFRWTSNQLDIGTEKGSGGGSARNMRLLTDNTARVTIGSAGTVTLNTTLALNAQNISTDTTTGTKIGTATTEKIGFFNATPVVQPTAVANATDAATVITQLNALLTRLRTLGLIAT